MESWGKGRGWRRSEALQCHMVPCRQQLINWLWLSTMFKKKTGKMHLSNYYHIQVEIMFKKSDDCFELGQKTFDDTSQTLDVAFPVLLQEFSPPKVNRGKRRGTTLTCLHSMAIGVKNENVDMKFTQ